MTILLHDSLIVATYDLKLSVYIFSICWFVLISTYSGVAIELSLKDYFENAKEYYLIDDDEKTLIDGRTYFFKSFIGGTHTLIFSASNDNGECPDFVTVTIEVNEVESGAWLGITTSNGSVNFVKFTDADGNDIDGLSASLEDKNIVVILPDTGERYLSVW